MSQNKSSINEQKGINTNNVIKDNIDNFLRFFNILTNEPSEFVKVLGDENIIKIIIGNINNKLNMEAYLNAINKYFNGNPNCHLFSAKQIKDILNNHNLYKEGKIDDNLFNIILNICRLDEYNNLFDPNCLNIQKNLKEYKKQ